MRESQWCSEEDMDRRRTVNGYAKESTCKYIIVPTLLYGSEVWAIIAKDRERMGVMEMKCMRAMCVVSIMDKDRNEEVRRKCGSEINIGERMI
jgi:hypothetical protein